MAEMVYIEREPLLKSKQWNVLQSYDSAMAKAIILGQPAADVVEVVHCKDCKHWLKDVAGCTDFVGRCEWANYMVGAAGYCVYGERVDGKGEDE